MFIWNYVFQVFMTRYWGDRYRTIPVFLKDLPDDMLGNFAHTPCGINSIWLAKNQDLTDRELMGVLLHEMCHHVVFEEYGCEDVLPHGFEWMAQMRKVGFEDPDWETDGCDFFSEQEYKEILKLLPEDK
tara:strand:- start:1547 stop:1933 length:387 start_codon:yes stop_codon:yes gene_type:complete